MPRTTIQTACAVSPGSRCSASPAPQTSNPSSSAASSRTDASRLSGLPCPAPALDRLRPLGCHIEHGAPPGQPGNDAAGDGMGQRPSRPGRPQDIGGRAGHAAPVQQRPQDQPRQEEHRQRHDKQREGHAEQMRCGHQPHRPCHGREAEEQVQGIANPGQPAGDEVIALAQAQRRRAEQGARVSAQDLHGALRPAPALAPVGGKVGGDQAGAEHAIHVDRPAARAAGHAARVRCPRTRSRSPSRRGVGASPPGSASWCRAAQWHPVRGGGACRCGRSRHTPSSSCAAAADRPSRDAPEAPGRCRRQGRRNTRTGRAASRAAPGSPHRPPPPRPPAGLSVRGRSSGRRP